MSRKQSSPAAYNDVKFVMDMALEKPGLRYESSTVGRAVHFKQRCNRYRNLLREMDAEVAMIPGRRGQTAYDTLVIRMVDDEGNSTTKGRHLIFDHHAPEGKIFDPETGKEIKVEIPGIVDTITENDRES